MKILYSLLGILLFTGLGCSPSALEPVSGGSEVNVSPQDTDEETVLETADWVRTNAHEGVSFLLPTGYNYGAGGDIDTGSWGWIDTGDEEPLGFFTYALMTCKLPNPNDCNLGTLTDASPEEVYEALLKQFSGETFVEVEGVSLGNTTGRAYYQDTANIDGTLALSVLFMGSKGVYLYRDFREEGAGDALFKAILSSIEVE